MNSINIILIVLVVLIVLVLIFIIAVISIGLYYLLGSSSPTSTPTFMIQKLKTVDNFYLKYVFNEEQPGVEPGIFTKTSDPQNASEFLIDDKLFKYVQRNQNGYQTYFLNVVEPNNNIYPENNSYNYLEIITVGDDSILRTKNNTKCLNINLTICSESDPSCNNCLSLIRE
jgi:hypothetical protein